MCLAVPGKIVAIEGTDPLTRMGKIEFSGVIKDINLAYVPEAKINDYVIVHVGFALEIINADEAIKLIEDINSLNGDENDLKKGF